MKKAVRRIESNLSDIRHTLDKQAISIDTHIKRTDALQDIVTKLHRKMTLGEGALMLLGMLAMLLGVAKMVLKAVGYG